MVSASTVIFKGEIKSVLQTSVKGEVPNMHA